MKQPPDQDALLAAYFVEGINTLPDRVVDAVLDEVHRTRRRRVIGPWRTRSLLQPSLAAAAVAVVLVAGALVMNREQPPATSDPSGSPTAGPSASPSATPTAPAVSDPAGSWIATGTMTTPRSWYTAVRLLDGRVLVAGGDGMPVGATSIQRGLTSAELYDPAIGSWSSTGSLLHPWGGFRATLLRDGRVLVGDNDEVDNVPNHGAELYDPDTGTWSAAGDVPGETGPTGTATVLANGDVLVAGLDGSWLYHPDTDTWSVTGTMLTPRYNHTATLLPDGRVLVAGGDIPPDRAVDSAELYDPSTGTWSPTAGLSPTGNIRYDIITATLLRDGTVLVVRPSTTERYDPATGTWTAAGERTRPGTTNESATLLSDGRVLVVATDETGSATAELYDPGTGSWATAGSPLRQHHWLPATLLLDGTVLLAGGDECRPDSSGCPTGVTGASELYVPSGISAPILPVFPSPSPPPSVVPTVAPTLLPAAVGPVPPEAREWIVRVVNESAEGATLFVAEEGGEGMSRLVGRVTPNVVPPGATMNVTFQLPAAGTTGWWIVVNAHPDYGGLLDWSQVPLAGEIRVGVDGRPGWVSP